MSAKNIKKSNPKYEDMTPTWESIIMVYAEAAVNGETLEGRDAGRSELIRLAKFADAIIAERKAARLREEE